MEELSLGARVPEARFDGPSNLLVLNEN